MTNKDIPKVEHPVYVKNEQTKRQLFRVCWMKSDKLKRTGWMTLLSGANAYAKTKDHSWVESGWFAAFL